MILTPGTLPDQDLQPCHGMPLHRGKLMGRARDKRSFGVLLESSEVRAATRTQAGARDEART